MKPLTTWTCDTCGEQVEPSLGTVVARRTDDQDARLTDFRIVHKNIDGLRCDPGSENGYRFNVDLDSFVGQDGMARLLALLSAGPLKGSGSLQVADLDEYVDLFRRLQVPHYEQARQRFGDAYVVDLYGGANEHLPYMPRELEHIAKG